MRFHAASSISALGKLLSALVSYATNIVRRTAEVDLLEVVDVGLVVAVIAETLDDRLADDLRARLLALLGRLVGVHQQAVDSRRAVALLIGEADVRPDVGLPVLHGLVERRAHLDPELDLGRALLEVRHGVVRLAGVELLQIVVHLHEVVADVAASSVQSISGDAQDDGTRSRLVGALIVPKAATTAVRALEVENRRDELADARVEVRVLGLARARVEADEPAASVAWTSFATCCSFPHFLQKASRDEEQTVSRSVLPR